MMPGKRKRSSSDSAGIGENENPIEKLTSEVQNLQENVGKILEKLEKMEKLEETEDSGGEEKPSFNSVISPGSLMRNTPNNGMPPAIGRSFVLKHVFENVSEFEEEKRYYSEEEEHFGVPWCMHMFKKDKHIGFFSLCGKSMETGKWAIDTKFTLKMNGVNMKTTTAEGPGVFGNYDESERCSGRGRAKFMTMETLRNDYLVDDKLTAEVHMKINKMTGVYEENSKNFDESVKKCSDVILKIADEKFYVSKLFLAYHSTYFESLFLGQFQESNQSEIELSGIAPEDFQKFLEVLYGDPSIDDITVEGILLVADMYDTSIVIEKCEKFLMNESKKSNRKKLQMSIKYNLDNLKKKCMSEIKTVADIKSMISGTIKDLDPSITTELLEKSISLQ